MKVDLYSWILILKWGVSDTSMVQEREGFEKKMIIFLSSMISPARTIFVLEIVKLWPYSRFFFTAKVGGKYPHPLFLDEAVPNQKYQPFFLRF